ncbi:hypothetical protein K443DRAFT_673142 [Laccaria amethystina LaAM-08-1]|uniref:Uncharacterized protein n=1 Tax=Laccaria amethystina LaAM-08-1 TaxID=1095629 RepID=A0A0C9YC78_9AGAR|nr:hypothetical protein K443DRAFT_673142 [Laccaria amethystina LaAM-08-1]
MSRSLRIGGWRSVNTTAALIPRQHLWLYTTRDKLQLRPSTTVAMCVVRIALLEVESSTAVSIRMLRFRLF